MTYVWWSIYAVAWVMVALVLLFGAKKLFDWLSPYSVDVQLTEKDNPCVGLVLSGFLLGVVAIIVGVFSSGGETEESFSVARFLTEIGPVLLFGVIGMVMLFFAGIINDKAVLHKFCCQKAILDDRNMGVAVMMAAFYLASGLIIGGGISGSFSLASAVLTFITGQIGLIVFALLYQKITRYDDLKEIGELKNTAAATAFAGNILAYGIILMKGVSMSGGAIETRLDRVFHFLYYALVGCLLMIVIRAVTDRVFLPKEKLSKEIAEDRNLSAGFIEAGLALAASIVLINCL